MDPSEGPLRGNGTFSPVAPGTPGGPCVKREGDSVKDAIHDTEACARVDVGHVRHPKFKKKNHLISPLFYHLDAIKSVLKHENKEEGSWQLCDDPSNLMLCHNIPSTFSYVVPTSGRYSLKN